MPRTTPSDLPYRLSWTPVQRGSGISGSRRRVYTLPPTGGSLAQGRPAPAETAWGVGSLSNERSTEEIVRRHLATAGLPGQVVEEQTSSNPRVRAALGKASKSGTGAGKPEFIVTLPATAPDLVFVVECKASTSHHESPNRDKPADYAVDGVLSYASHLSRSFDVIAVAVSGTRPDYLKVSAFRQLKGASQAESLNGPDGPVTQLHPLDDLKRWLTYDPAVKLRTHSELMAYSRDLHNFMRDYGKLSEPQKPLVVSAVLLALRDEAFKVNWPKFGYKHQARELHNAVDRAVQDAGLGAAQREIILSAYSFIKTHPELSKPAAGNGPTPLYTLIEGLDKHVRPFIDAYTEIDVIGEFYGEFLRYTGGDSRGLGIVLTPRHLTELFAKIANVGPNDTVVDICTGTGGFLISSLVEMDSKARNDSSLRRRIRQRHLIGVEQQPEMFALAAANMILRGDGKSNLYRGDCFDPAISELLKSGADDRHSRPNIGLINPPYGQKREGTHELDFVDQLLDILQPGGTAVAVVPMSCAIANHPSRSRILSKHTLMASISLPNDLFHNIGAVTCALVFRAHQPHDLSPQPTWFGFWKDDGFVKTKNRGRIDLKHTWPQIRDRWLEAYHARKVSAGESVVQRVGPMDEWTAEAYLETDYSKLNRKDFEATIRRFAIFKLLHEQEVAESTEARELTEDA